MLISGTGLRASMSQSVDALWKSVVQQLQQLPAQGPEQQCEAFFPIIRQVDVLINKRSLPRATMKHLIRDLKVCVALLLGHDNAWHAASQHGVGMTHRNVCTARID